MNLCIETGIKQLVLTHNQPISNPMDLYNLKAIETGIVLAGTILLFSLLVTAANEFTVRMLNMRGRLLRMFFIRFLGSDLAKNLEQNVWITFHRTRMKKHPITGTIRRPKEVLPQDFARAIMMECTRDSIATMLRYCKLNRAYLPTHIFDTPFRIAWPDEEEVTALLQKWHDAPHTDIPRKEMLATLLHHATLQQLSVLKEWIEKQFPEDITTWQKYLEDAVLDSRANEEFAEEYKRYRMADAASVPAIREKILHQGKIVISCLPEPARSYFQVLYQEAEGDTLKFQKNLEIWYDHQMGRLSRWYQDRMIFISIGIGCLLAGLMNVNPIILTESLWKDDALRIEMANYYAQDSTLNAMHDMVNEMDFNKNLKKEIESIENKISTADSSSKVLLNKKLDSLNTDYLNRSLLVMNTATQQIRALQSKQRLPIGWEGKSISEEIEKNCVKLILGWILMGILASWGAPFWYEVLARLISARKLMQSSSGQKK